MIIRFLESLLIWRLGFVVQMRLLCPWCEHILALIRRMRVRSRVTGELLMLRDHKLTFCLFLFYFSPVLSSTPIPFLRLGALIIWTVLGNLGPDQWAPLPTWRGRWAKGEDVLTSRFDFWKSAVRCGRMVWCNGYESSVTRFVEANCCWWCVVWRKGSW